METIDSISISKLQERLYDALERLSDSEVLNAFIHFYGTKLLTREFAKFIIDEGYVYPEELGFEGEPDEEEI